MDPSTVDRDSPIVVASGIGKESSEMSNRGDGWCLPVIILSLILQFILAVHMARGQTPTHDEYWHLPIGLFIWKTGNFDFDIINPPLLRLWAAFPLWFGGAHLDTSVPFSAPSALGDLFWMSNPTDNLNWFVWGRTMIALMNACTGFLLALWSRRWFGNLAGTVAVILWCTCPTILAHGGLVTHDAAATFGFVSTLFAVVCWAERPSFRRAAISGLCLGIAQLLKLTCVLLFPLVVITWLLLRAARTKSVQSDDRPQDERVITDVSDRQKPRRVNIVDDFAEWMIVFVVAVAVINLGYLGGHTGQSLKSMRFASARFQQLQQLPVIGTIPLPVPRNYVLGFDRISGDLKEAHPVFLDGIWTTGGFRRYYIEALTYKLPLNVWMLILLAGIVAIQSMRGRSTGSTSTANWRRLLVVVLPVISLIVPASLGANQIGIRYIMPGIPFLYLFASQSARLSVVARQSWLNWITIALVATLPYSLRYHPHHLTYFNEVAGGPDGGRYHLVDSNLDWGQDLHNLANYLKDAGIEKVGLAYFGTVHPHSVGIDFGFPPDAIPQPGDYAISVNFLMGYPFFLRPPTEDRKAPMPTLENPNLTNERRFVGLDTFGYFRFFQPRARIGHSIYVFHLTDDDVIRFHQFRSRQIKRRS